MNKIYILIVLSIAAIGCKEQTTTTTTGIEKATAEIQVGSDGLTVEQRNVKGRLEEDNKIGTIKHLYVISAFSGEVIIYSTVDGKVTSGNKRLTPKTVQDGDFGAFPVEGLHRGHGTSTALTNEVLGDDGTYGTSMNYLFWWDVKGNYHQHYVNGGQIVHISSQALPVKSITINLSE